MTEPFVAQLRTRGNVIELAAPNGPAITVRVEIPEVWDTVKVHASPDERVLTVKRRALEALRSVGLVGREQNHPNQLSGGQQQRVAIARALVNDPKLILADEPTGALDSRTSVEVMEIFQRLNRERRITLVLVTHEQDIAAYADRVVVFKDGRIQKDYRVTAPRDAAEELKNLPAVDDDEEEEVAEAA